MLDAKMKLTDICYNPNSVNATRGSESGISSPSRCIVESHWWCFTCPW